MIALDIHGLDIVVLLQFLSEGGSILMRRIWHSESRITAAFVKENFPRPMLPGQVFVVALEHDIPSRKCRVDAIASASQSPFFSTPASLESAFKESLDALAVREGWQCDLASPKTKYVGAKCPLCGAFYGYDSEKIQNDRTVRCQNCNRTFRLGED